MLASLENCTILFCASADRVLAATPPSPLILFSIFVGSPTSSDRALRYKPVSALILFSIFVGSPTSSDRALRYKPVSALIGFAILVISPVSSDKVPEYTLVTAFRCCSACASAMFNGSGISKLKISGSIP